MSFVMFPDWVLDSHHHHHQPLVFCTEITIKGRQDLRLPLLVEFGQLCVSSKQGSLVFKIWVKSQFISQFFLHRDKYQGMQHLRLSLLVGCGRLCLSSNQITGFFDHEFVWKELINIFVFYVWSQSSREGSISDYHFWCDLGRCVSGPIRQQDSFINNIYHWKEPSLSLIFCIDIVIEGRQHLRLPILLPGVFESQD